MGTPSEALQAEFGQGFRPTKYSTEERLGSRTERLNRTVTNNSFSRHLHVYTFIVFQKYAVPS